MAFTGRATYDNDTLIAEDVSDLVSTISPFETPLLDFIGDAATLAGFKCDCQCHGQYCLPGQWHRERASGRRHLADGWW